MERYLLPNRDYYAMSQTGVKQYQYPRRHSHNAIWDSTVGPDGKFYYALASEIATSNYVRFCCYDSRSGEVEELFRIEDVILPTDRSIRASKFHTSISFMNDGRMVMTTHTTDKSPRHPTWLPLPHYHHQWEGFSGGQIIVYDPVLKKAESLGTPVPYESIYGATYDAKYHALYFTGMMRGRLYRYDFETRRVKCLGKVGENNMFRLSVGPDQHIYSASRSGWIYKIDVDQQKIVDLGFQFEHETYDHNTRYNGLSIARIGPDNRLYMAVMYSRSIYALDCSTGAVEDMGYYLPTDRVSPDENRNGIFGMDFDSQGVLWYVVTALNNYEDNREFGIPATLFRWDVANGGQPEYAGILGTPDFGGAWVSEVSIFRDEDILYAANSNHSLDGPGLISVNLKEFVPTMGQQTQQLTDGYFDPDDPDYIDSGTFIQQQELLMHEYSCGVRLSHMKPILLWRALAPDQIENSAVKGLYYDDDGILHGVCGADKMFYFTIRNSTLHTIKPVEEVEQWKIDKALNRELPDIRLNNQMPHIPGRQYKRNITAAVCMDSGQIFAGTQDGVAAVINDGVAFGLGPVANNGPVHQVVVTPDGKRVFGVAGDEDDIAILFTYDDSNGLRQLGFMDSGSCASIDDLFFLTVVRSCAISPDGKYLAVGADERIGTVVIYELDNDK